MDSDTVAGAAPVLPPADADRAATAAQDSQPDQHGHHDHDQAQKAPTRDAHAPVRTPEMQYSLPQRPGNASAAGNTTSNTNNAVRAAAAQLGDQRPGIPGDLPPFDWDDFEGRYEQAIAEMNGGEKELLEEFDRLVQYFHVWASASSAHDDERAVKRLQTRERYVRIAEQSLGQRKQHLSEVVRAFQSALALLSQP